MKYNFIYYILTIGIRKSIKYWLSKRQITINVIKLIVPLNFIVRLYKTILRTDYLWKINCCYNV